MLSKILKQKRKISWLTQIELSVLSKVGYETIRKIESWLVLNPWFFTVIKIFNALNIDAFEFARLCWYDFNWSKFAIK